MALAEKSSATFGNLGLQKEEKHIYVTYWI